MVPLTTPHRADSQPAEHGWDFRVTTPSGMPSMLLSLISVIVTLWVSQAHGQETTCDPPAIAHGLYTPHRTKHRLEDEIRYRCDNGFYPSSRGNTAKCTDGGWAPPPRCSLQPCELPEIENGVLYWKEGYRSYFPVAVGQWYYYSCDDNYVTPTQVYWGYVTCTPDGWSPDIPCIRKCVVSNLEHGDSAHNGQTYVLGESMRVFCHPGYSLHNRESVVTCTEDGWSPALTCLKHCDMPLLENAIAITTGKVFRPDETLDYQCLDGYETRDGRTKGSMVCGNNGWSHLPSCFKSAEKCGPPPAVGKADITSFPLAAYPPGSRVEYQCQPYYELQGPNYVTCIDAKWSEPPKCLDPCVIAEEILNENNIQLKGKEDKTYYAKTGEIVEFMCKSGHKMVTSGQSLEAVCREGTVQVPTCE